MKPLATIGDAVLHGGPAWRADLRANGIARRPPPSSERLSQPDRGLIEQPGEREEPKRAPPKDIDMFPPPAQQTLVKLERATLAGEREQQEMAPKKERKKRMIVDGAVRRAAIRRVMVDGEIGRSVGRDLGVSLNTVSGWVFQWRKEHGNRPPPDVGSKTLVSAPSSVGAVDQAAKNLVDMLGAYITAAIDARVEQRVNEAIAERMKRLL